MPFNLSYLLTGPISKCSHTKGQDFYIQIVQEQVQFLTPLLLCISRVIFKLQQFLKATTNQRSNSVRYLLPHW